MDDKDKKFVEKEIKHVEELESNVEGLHKKFHGGEMQHKGKRKKIKRTIKINQENLETKVFLTPKEVRDFVNSYDTEGKNVEIFKIDDAMIKVVISKIKKEEE